MTLQSRNASPLYKAEAEWVKNVHSTRQKLAGICAQCLNRTVRVQTIDGHTFEGVVIGHDHTYLHIASRDTRFWGPASSAAITTLVLFELLVITLLI
ncbi:hypothetical protein ACFPVX_09695 [Cohnella faecalis]|uniref:hypothetical protein n=1 Tax=Cohnella faecalis TaxID=2315694 RepID=UPI00361CED1E